MYRTQLERVSDNWSNKIGEFERLNGSLRTSLQDLQQQNDELKIQVNINVEINSVLKINVRPNRKHVIKYKIIDFFYEGKSKKY